MIKHIWSVLAQKSIIESESNSLSIIDVIEELTVGLNKNAPAFPADASINIPLNYEIVSYFISDKKNPTPKATMLINLKDPKGNIIKTFEPQIVWEAGKDRLRVKIKIIGLTVKGPGLYTYEIRLKEEEQNEYKTISELPLVVKIETSSASPNNKRSQK